MKCVQFRYQWKFEGRKAAKLQSRDLVFQFVIEERF